MLCLYLGSFSDLSSYDLYAICNLAVVCVGVLYLELGRRNRKFSQDQVAKLAHVEQPHVSAIERKAALPTPDQAIRLAAAVGVPVELLTQEVPIPEVDEEPTEPSEAVAQWDEENKSIWAEYLESLKRAESDPRKDVRSNGTALFVVHGGYRFLISARHVLWDEHAAGRVIEGARALWDEIRGTLPNGYLDARMREAEAQAELCIFNKIFRVQTLDEVLKSSSEPASSMGSMFFLVGSSHRSDGCHTFSSPSLDLAVITLDGDYRTQPFAESLEAAGYAPISTDDFSSPSGEGAEIFTVGFPGATTVVARRKSKDESSWQSALVCLPTFAFGRISMLHSGLDYFWCDLSVYPGNSGGPIIEGDKLVGVVSKQAELEDEASGYARARLPFAKAIKAEHLIYVLERQREKDRRSWFARTLEGMGRRRPDIPARGPEESKHVRGE